MNGERQEKPGPDTNIHVDGRRREAQQGAVTAKVRIMNWETVFQCVQNIAGMKRDAPHAMVLLRQEVIASSQLTVAEKDELHLVLDGLQQANMYGQISFVSQLKEVLSRHAEFKAKYAEFGMRRAQS